MKSPVLPALLRGALRLVFFMVLFEASSRAHDEPTSFIDLKVSNEGIHATVTASCIDLAHEIPGVEPAQLLLPSLTDERKQEIGNLLMSRLALFADGTQLQGNMESLVPVEARRDMQAELVFPWKEKPGKLVAACQLFPYDPRHRSFLNVYEGGALSRQEIFQGPLEPRDLALQAPQSIASVVGEFIKSGIHHIFIGPDHILFVVGLLLLGGTLGHLLKIVTAFTVAHSITLGLAAFRIINPPSSVVEPAIAISIVFVGVHALLGRNSRDPRILFAFCFGLIHGFGFASVLQEMELPRHALGWSLFAFNTGVEIGQACIVLLVAPVLALIQNRRPEWSAKLITTASLLVTGAGAFWFFQRILN